MNTDSQSSKNFDNIGDLVESFHQNSASALSFYQGKTLSGKMSYSDLYERVHSLVKVFENLGIREGDRILILTQNRIEVPILLLAIFYVGAVAVPLNPTAPTEEWAFVAKHSAARGLFATQELRSRFPESSERLEFALDLETAMKAPFTGRSGPRENRGETTCLVLYTSGTTGTPKGVALSQRALLYNAWSMADNFRLKESTQFAVLPLYHAHALGFGLMTSLTTGGHLVFSERFDPFAWGEIINRESVAYTSVVPNLLPVLLAAGVHAKKVPSLRGVLVSSAPLTTDLAKQFETRTEIRLIQGWGLSEYTNFACCLSPMNSKEEHEALLFRGEHSSIGSPLKGTEVAVVDEKNEIVEEGCSGELWIRGPSQMNSYFSDPRATEKVLHKDWLRTGDLGYRIGGNFFITGRIKEVIIRNGEKISPIWVEKTILGSLPHFESRVAVLGFFHKSFGEEIGMYVDTTTLGATDLEELKVVLEKIQLERRPKVVMTGTTAIPRTHTGKVQRRKLLPLFSGFSEMRGPVQFLAVN